MWVCVVVARVLVLQGEYKFGRYKGRQELPSFSDRGSPSPQLMPEKKKSDSPSKLNSSRGGQTSHRASASASSSNKKRSARPKAAKKPARKKADGSSSAAMGDLEDVAEEDEGEEGVDETPGTSAEAMMSGLALSGPLAQQAAEADEAEERARAARDTGRLDEAERLYRTALQLRRGALGNRHALTISTIECAPRPLFHPISSDPPFDPLCSLPAQCARTPSVPLPYPSRTPPVPHPACAY